MPILSVCDTCSINAAAVNELVHPNGNQTKQTGALLQYRIGRHVITHVFDPSHLIKVVRNNFEMKNIAHFATDRWQPGSDLYDSSLQIASWDDIAELYRIDLRSIQRRVPKLTDEHLKPSKLKMKVSIAAQVFSETCATAMLQCVGQRTLPQHCTSTAGLLLFINDLFDSINGSTDHPAYSLKGTVTRESNHFEFWEYALVMLENMFFVDKSTGERNNRSSVLKKFESTIRGYQAFARKCFDSNITAVKIRCDFIFITFRIYICSNYTIDIHRMEEKILKIRNLNHENLKWYISSNMLWFIIYRNLYFMVNCVSFAYY